MAKKKNYDEQDGVWRTIGGRRVFIKKGQDLSSAMRDSGKFGRVKRSEEQYRSMDKTLRTLEDDTRKKYFQDFAKARELGSEKLEKEARDKRDNRYREIGKERDRLREELLERRAGKVYLDDYPDAYRHYERDWESTQRLNDDIGLRKEFGLSRQEYPEERDYLPGGKNWNEEWQNSREMKFTKERYAELKNAKNERDYNKVDKEWTDLAKKMEKDYDEFGTTNWKDEKRLNELSRERDILISQDKSTALGKYMKSREDGKEIYDVFRQMDYREMNAFSKSNPEAIKKMQEYLKSKDYNRKYDSVEDRYNKDKSFRDMLKNEHQKSLDTTRKEINSYFDMTREDREKLVGDENDLYKVINEDYGNIDRDEFDKIYKEELLNRTARDVAKSFGAKEVSIRGKKEKLDNGNDYLPKASKVEKAGTSNRKEVSDNIQAHILEHYDNPVDFMEQMDAMDWLPTRWRAGEELASGGSYLIYYDDQREFLNSLNINPKGKSFSDDRVFQTYNSLIGRESERLYNRLEKLFEQYKKEHDGNVTLDDFRKWFK